MGRSQTTTASCRCSLTHARRRTCGVRRFADATLPQLEDVLRRMSTVSETVDTLITSFEGQVFEPGDDLAVWFTQREREYRRFRSSMSVREFAAALARLLPDDTAHAKKVLA